MARRCPIFATVFFVLVANDMFAASESPAPDIRSSPRRETVVCGPHAVYLMLRAHGIDAKNDIIAKLMPNHPQGMALTEVRDALSASGLAVTIRRCTPAELSTRNTPCILLLENDSLTGHYMLVLSSNNSSIWMVDPTTGRMFAGPLDKLPNIWPGYAIIPDEPIILLRKTSVPIVGCVLSLVVASRLLRLRRMPKRLAWASRRRPNT